MWIKFAPILQKPIKSCIFVKKLRSNEKDSLYCTDWTVNCKQYFVRHQKKNFLSLKMEESKLSPEATIYKDN